MADYSISVVICAYTDKRWSQTCAAVESVRAQRTAATEIILIVDHNPDLFARLAGAFEDVAVVENREAPGVSGARNTGVALAQGDIVAFLDDDAAAEPDWLKFICDSYSDPAVIGVGGLILPRWETSRPRWFPPEFYWVVGCSYLGMPGPYVPVRNLIGANMSFRREAFGIGGGFRTDVGRNSDERPFGCEETEFCIRLGQRSPGSVQFIENRAAVSHFVPWARCRFSYFASRCYAEGLSKAQITTTVGGTDGLSSERHYTTRTLPAGIARGGADLLRGDPWGAARAAAIVVGLGAATAGYLIGSARRRTPV
ncbi:MAG TPA: glycosyltransferase family 2 protein [Streptosporangiaceae bacterium]|nr:glycosyltransferase family 2 protein [Streptosporangiaceae bacterium]